MGQKRISFKTVSQKHLLTIYVNKSTFLGSKMGQTKHKPLRTRDFFRLTFGTYSFFQNNCKEPNITLYIKYSNTKVSKSHKQNVDNF